ncbi:hypothetical protein, partial [Aquitalea aquatica]|uniref:hypothetical protein n=1 Tax=Aquitalea aquatica TaxID=3044273 RepID=UPI001C6A7A8A
HSGLRSQAKHSGNVASIWISEFQAPLHLALETAGTFFWRSKSKVPRRRGETREVVFAFDV